MSMKKELLLGTILLLSMFSCGNNQTEDYTIKTFNKIDKEGKITYTYENVIPQLKEFLDSLKDQYQGEMILISAHAGLHTLGLDPHSDVEEVFGGKDAYNIEKSNEMVDLLNEYALSYQMNISFQFGHNHSKQESEFLLTPGERIYTTKSYLEKSVVNEEIQFSYGHMGYLSTSIGSANAHYTLMSLNDTSYTLSLKQLDGLSITTIINKK